MKIAIVTFAAYGAGGQYTAHLANALSDVAKVAVLLPAAADTGPLSAGVSLIKLPLPFNLVPAAFTALKPAFQKVFMEALDHEKPDVVHLVFEHRFPYFYACRLSRRYPLVATIHEPRSIANRGPVGNLIAGSLQYMNNSGLARCSDRVIVHGENLKTSRLISKLAADKVKVVPIGALSFASGDKAAPQKTGKNVLFFGRIAPYKGLEYLIEAAEKIRPSLPGLTVTIAGEGDLSKYTGKLGDRAFFQVHNMYIPDDEAAGLFQTADLVVLPYTDGTQTLLISLAASFSKPAVVTDVGNFAEMVEDGKTGLVVPPRDTQALADAMLKLLKDDDLRIAMGQNARRSMQAQYSWEAIVKITTSVYNEAIAAHAKRAEG